MFYVLNNLEKSAFMRQGHHMLPTEKSINMWPDSRGFDLKSHLRLCPLSEADIISRQFWPRSDPTKCLMFFSITKVRIRS